jgi:hypothetical protein
LESIPEIGESSSVDIFVPVDHEYSHGFLFVVPEYVPQGLLAFVVWGLSGFLRCHQIWIWLMVESVTVIAKRLCMVVLSLIDLVGYHR